MPPRSRRRLREIAAASRQFPFSVCSTCSLLPQGYRSENSNSRGVERAKCEYQRANTAVRLQRPRAAGRQRHPFISRARHLNTGGCGWSRSSQKYCGPSPPAIDSPVLRSIGTTRYEEVVSMWSTPRSIVTAVVVLTLLLIGARPARAQSDNTGVVDGRVADESKSPVPGATVTARNTATGLTRATVSSTLGTYRIEFLPPGAYEIIAELTGFARVVTKDVQVQVGSSTNIDVTMKVAGLNETVSVTAESPLVQTTKSDVGQVITATLVENMPLSGRRFQDLSLLVPGTRPSNCYDPTKTEVGGISYGGMTGRAVNITVDGGDNNDGVVRGLLQQFSEDAIQEYKVTTGRYSAEYGRS